MILVRRVSLSATLLVQCALLLVLVVTPWSVDALSDHALIQLHRNLLTEPEMEAFHRQLRRGKQSRQTHAVPPPQDDELVKEIQSSDETAHHQFDAEEMQIKMDVCTKTKTTNCLQNDEHEVIMYLLQHRHTIDRQLWNLYDSDPLRPARQIGVLSHTTSTDSTVASYLQAHVHQMHHLEERGEAVRQWDPLYHEMFQRMEEIEMVHDFIENGVAVKHTSNSDCGIDLIVQHANVVSGFVDEGTSEVFREHALPESCAV